MKKYLPTVYAGVAGFLIITNIFAGSVYGLTELCAKGIISFSLLLAVAFGILFGTMGASDSTGIREPETNYIFLIMYVVVQYLVVRIPGLPNQFVAFSHILAMIPLGIIIGLAIKRKYLASQSKV